MAERIVYVLGAGFSAPAGIPTTANFIEVAKDLTVAQPDMHADVLSVLKDIDALGRIKNIYDADLSNIEEVLSILEMQAQLDIADGVALRERFVGFLKSVISEKTPRFKDPERWNEQAPIRERVWPDEYGRKYGVFAQKLLGIVLRQSRDSGPSRSIAAFHAPGDYHNSVITLNYDTILEDAAKRLDKLCSPPQGWDSIRFSAEWDPSNPNLPYLAKLHGCVSDGSVVAPTWNKSIAHDSIRTAWRTAHHLLSNANRIRFLGYSLPTTDAYVRYLFKSAIAAGGPLQNLKSIDVYCLDDAEGSVRARYRAFARDFRNLQFFEKNLRDYLEAVSDVGENAVDRMGFRPLEESHRH